MKVLRISLLTVAAISILSVGTLAQQQLSPTPSPQPANTPTKPPETHAATASPTGSQGTQKEDDDSAFYKASPQRIAAAIIAAIGMLTGLVLVFSRLKAKNQGFGPNALKALGLVLFLPTLIIVAVAVPGFKTETLAALLGTVAGYVLSHSKTED
jgi:hypothetical protein